MRPITEQARARGVPVPLGATAKELRDHGWEVPEFVQDAAMLDTPVEGEPVKGTPTGLVWRNWRPTSGC